MSWFPDVGETLAGFDVPVLVAAVEAVLKLHKPRVNPTGFFDPPAITAQVNMRTGGRATPFALSSQH